MFLNSNVARIIIVLGIVNTMPALIQERAAETLAATASDNDFILKQAMKVLKKIAGDSPPAKIFLKYHEAHFKLFKEVMDRVDDAKKMSDKLAALEKNRQEFSTSAKRLIEYSEEVPNDPWPVIMGDRIVATEADMTYFREYFNTTTDFRVRFRDALKTANAMEADYQKLKAAIEKTSDFTRKFLMEELVLLDLKLDATHGKSFEQLVGDIKEDLSQAQGSNEDKIEIVSDYVLN